MGKITTDVHLKQEARLNNAYEGSKSFVEIQQWFKDEFNIKMEYHAINKYVRRKFGANQKLLEWATLKKNQLRNQF